MKLLNLHLRIVLILLVLSAISFAEQLKCTRVTGINNINGLNSAGICKIVPSSSVVDIATFYGRRILQLCWRGIWISNVEVSCGSNAFRISRAVTLNPQITSCQLP